MAEYLSPGVYVEEFESGPRAMTAASTSIPGFLGIAEKGPTSGQPRLITCVADFARIYGAYVTNSAFKNYRYLRYAVEHFFANGGGSCYVMRVSTNGGPAQKCITVTKDSKTPETNPKAASGVKLLFKASSEGSWGNNLTVTFNASNDVHAATDEVSMKSYTANITVQHGDLAETFESVSFDKEADNFVLNALAASALVVVTDVTTDDKVNSSAEFKIPNAFGESLAQESSSVKNSFKLEGGEDVKDEEDGKAAKIASNFIGDKDDAPGSRAGLQAFLENDVVSMLCAPGVTDEDIQKAILTHCETLQNRIAIFDMPMNTSEVAKLQEVRQKIMSDDGYAAMYHPWIEFFDSAAGKPDFFPPSGAVLGVFARSDNTHGVHKAPANEIVRGARNLKTHYSAAEQGHLNPRGVNLIRSFPNQGILIWGARTVSSNPLWRYVNVRRLFIYLKESIKASTNWVVFEPNSELLWLRVKRTIEVFLEDEWRKGSFMGASPQEAFYVNIGRSTMTQSDIDNGRLICVIGVAPVKPAEFVIFRLTQQTLNS